MFNFWGNFPNSFSKAIVSFFIPTRSICQCEFLHILKNFFAVANRFNCSIFKCVYLLSLYFFWWSVCLNILPFFNCVICFLLFEFWESFICSIYKYLIRYVISKYIFPVNGLSFFPLTLSFKQKLLFWWTPTYYLFSLNELNLSCHM